MIIKATFSDNDYTPILEQYFNYFKFRNYNLYYKNCKDLKEFKDKSIESEDLLRKIIFETDKMTKEDLKSFTYIVSESIKEYIKINYNADYKYLINRLQVEVINTFEDKNENGEVIYYIISSDKYISM